MIRPVDNQRGLTLVEFTMVAALGAVIMLTLSSFYLSAQGMWLDSSIQAVSQRDATLFLGEIGRRIEKADQVIVTTNEVSLFSNSSQTCRIWWNPGDSHAQIDDMDAGKVTQWPANGRIQALQFHGEGTDPRVVYLDSLRIETPAGENIYLSSAFGVLNHP